MSGWAELRNRMYLMFGDHHYPNFAGLGPGPHSLKRTHPTHYCDYFFALLRPWAATHCLFVF